VRLRAGGLVSDSAIQRFSDSAIQRFSDYNNSALSCQLLFSKKSSSLRNCFFGIPEIPLESEYFFDFYF
jgi:hypothetical protein